MSDTSPKPSYKDSLNLPQTDFPMRADLPRREPDWIAQWDQQGIYAKMISKNEGHAKFTLHDGPPYANGNIHHGHILNKILKDIILKYKNLSGYLSEYVPGWDCHGLPIEHQVDKNLGSKKKDMSKAEIRKACREYAEKFVNIQREEFKRLGILGRWEKPYLTMSFDYEATIARELGKFANEGQVYRGSKPVYWCMRCQTALAEAEVEYEDHNSPSVYVAFEVKGSAESISEHLKGQNCALIIWTTTPWTLPANTAVAVHSHYTYAALQTSDHVYLIAEGLLEKVRANLNLQDARLIDRIPGRKLEGLVLKHPFLDRVSPVVFSDHVTIEQGTGCVHIAPGHGQEDYEVGLRYKLPILNPVGPRGQFTPEVGIESLIGQSVFEANPAVIEILKSNQALLKQEEISHSYPHCWRCKHPVIFRSTPQWFISMSHKDLRHRALDAIRRTQWIPYWGRERIYGMIENRPDWCISRQRSWGVPIIAFNCQGCHQVILDAKLIDRVADFFEKEGADAWYTKTASELLPPNFSCPHCQGKNFEKENDILDVWFDSGVSYAAVVEKNPLLQFPADIYLEGSDQHRGWFHSSLLASIGTREKPPYQAVLTHGFVVDGQGRKYSKSAKNYIPPDAILKKMGAEIFRMWAAAEDYRNDIRVSDEILSRLSETYRKIRNTCRFLLGNLHDFNPATDGIPFDQLLELDLWALDCFSRLTETLDQAYRDYEFHQIYHALNHFCTMELSSFYLDILKDRLYTSAPKSRERRSAQTVLFELIRGLASWMAPILSFTSEEIWGFLPAFENKAESVFLQALPKSPAKWRNDKLHQEYAQLRQVRDEALKALEIARQAKIIGSSLDAQLKIYAEGDLLKFLKKYETAWANLLIVSQVVLSFEIDQPTYESPTLAGLKFAVVPAEGKKCERCWNYSMTVGRSAEHPPLCDRCVRVLSPA